MCSTIIMEEEPLAAAKKLAATRSPEDLRHAEGLLRPLSLHSNNLQVRHLLAQVLTWMGRYQDAHVLLTKLVMQDASKMEGLQLLGAWYDLSLVAWALGRKEQAMIAFQQAMACCTTTSDVAARFVALAMKQMEALLDASVFTVCFHQVAMSFDLMEHMLQDGSNPVVGSLLGQCHCHVSPRTGRLRKRPKATTTAGAA